MKPTHLFLTLSIVILLVFAIFSFPKPVFIALTIAFFVSIALFIIALAKDHESI